MAEGNVRILKNFINGEWVEAATRSYSAVLNPATGVELARVPNSSPEAVQQAVHAAAAAFPAWSEVPVPRRAQIMFRYKALLEQHFEELAAVVTQEHGKPLADARASVQRGIEIVDFACGMPTHLLGTSLPNIAGGVDGEMVREPLGVCAGITPFNYPVMIPLWMFPIAIAAGNTFVLKPSQVTPTAAERIVQLAHEAGLPPGVLNLVHGDKHTATALITEPAVKAVSFVGSSAAARSVYAQGAALGKRVQAGGGAKNHLVVMPDANLDKTVPALLSSVFDSAGERCLSGSVVLAVGDVGDRLVERLASAARTWQIGDGAESGIHVGPMVTPAARQRVVGYIEVGVAEGATLVLDGRKDDLLRKSGACFVGLTIFDHVTPEMVIARDEIFGPVMVVVRVRDLDEALGIMKQSTYGNGAVIFTDSGAAARQFVRRADAGMVSVNVGVPAPLAFFSFGGRKDSLFGPLRLHGPDAVDFYTQRKSIVTRWW